MGLRNLFCLTVRLLRRGISGFWRSRQRPRVWFGILGGSDDFGSVSKIREHTISHLCCARARNARTKPFIMFSVSFFHRVTHLLCQTHCCFHSTEREGQRGIRHRNTIAIVHIHQETLMFTISHRIEGTVYALGAVGRLTDTLRATQWPRTI